MYKSLFNVDTFCIELKSSSDEEVILRVKNNIRTNYDRDKSIKWISANIVYHPEKWYRFKRIIERLVIGKN